MPERLDIAYTLTSAYRDVVLVHEWFARRLEALEASWEDEVSDPGTLVRLCQTMWRVKPVEAERLNAFVARLTDSLTRLAQDQEAIAALADLVAWNEEFSGHPDPVAARVAACARFEQYADEVAVYADFDSPDDVGSMIDSLETAASALGADVGSTVSYLEQLQADWPPEREDDDDDDDRRMSFGSSRGATGGDDIDGLFSSLVDDAS